MRSMPGMIDADARGLCSTNEGLRSGRRAQRGPACRPAAAATLEGPRTVPKNSVLVIGGTGTLGRQVVRRALDEGYEVQPLQIACAMLSAASGCAHRTACARALQVRCIVRPRQNPADFLRDWGATTVQADLGDPTSLPAALVGIHTVIDCATARPEESTQRIDWDGKVALIQCAQV